MQNEINWSNFAENLQAIHKTLQQDIDKEIAKSKITGPQLMVLDSLVDCNGLTMKELSKKVGLTHSTVSGIVDRLEKQNLVERKTDKSDRRYTRIYISEQVKDYIKKLIPDYYGPLLSKVKSAKKEEQLIITEGISKLRDLIDKNMS
ncbi:MarR family transcriptional regulator [Pullulanibacillus sp. KACC 23026]|uniref:MarR family winged helix-turn-helix transcriptional regulator n=1 Tax=Pullulanibacillus sp. KACC 23026 TaxID=3028315 RepID=UPI0023B16E85|nr:MarR family transcriptional regulator [Pullulanibacillus sp. KACC 23026]WEG13335.1 MarR family transcriptional regulator [Pullulanibacillus sp. KACC 23026]